MRIDGYFNANDEPAITLNLISSSLEVLVDTGFAGSLILPAHLSTGLALQFRGFDEFFTVTGDLLVAPAYSAEVNWLGRRVKVPVAISPDVKEALLGSQMLKKCILTIDYANRTVTITQG